MRRIFLLLTTAVLFHCGMNGGLAGGSSETETGTVTGCVLNWDSTAAGGATVGIKTISQTDSPSIVTFFPAQSQMTADSNGRFAFPSLPPGSYAVAALYHDRMGGMVRVDVVARDTADAVIRLAPITVHGGCELVWSAATNEIVFESASYDTGFLGLKAMNITSSTVRFIDSTKRQYGSLFASKDGAVLYYAVSDTQYLFASIFSVPLDASAPPGRIIPNIHFDRFAFFPESCWIAYRKAEVDSVFVFDASAGTQKFAAGLSAFPYDFSSDGTKLVCTGGKCSAMQCDIPSRVFIVEPASSRIDTVDLHCGPPLLLRLDADGLKVVYRRFEDPFYVMNVNTGSTIQLFAGSGYNYAIGWTPDGKSVALWSGSYPSTLHLINVSTAADRIVCREEVASGIAYSPSGTGIAYVGLSAGLPRICINNTQWQQ